MPKVMVMKCDHYQVETIRIKLESALMLLGGVHRLIPRGSRVFLKVNLLTGKEPSEAVTTHPAVVQALASLLLEAGMEVTIGDSPGGPFLSGRMDRIYRITGMKKAAEMSGARLNQNLESGEVVFPQAFRLKRFDMMQAVLEADAVISLCKMKTHSMTQMTGAVKNVFGVMPGLTKAALHFRFPQLEDFAHAMVDICEKVNPIISVMDGIEAMEGPGPSAGAVNQAGVLLVSTCPHHLDLAAARWMGMDPNQAPLLFAARQRELCHLDGRNLEWVGIRPESVNQKPFKMPPTHEPDFLLRYGSTPFLGRMLQVFSQRYMRPKPVINLFRCIRCGECAVICPAQVITMTPDPVIRMDACIRCFCCQEICPVKAVEIKRSRLLNGFHPAKNAGK